MAEDKKAAQMAANKTKKELYDTSIVTIKCAKAHGKMVKDKEYKVSASVAAILIEKGIAKKPGAATKKATSKK